MKGEPENVSEWRVVMQQNQSLEITKVALDAMGGDYAPAEPVKGAVDAVNARSDIKVLLIGQEDVVRKELEKYTYPAEQIEVIHAEEVIETAEPPVNAIRKKKQSSIVVGMNMVKQKEELCPHRGQGCRRQAQYLHSVRQVYAYL